MTNATLKINIWTSDKKELPDDLSEAFAPHVEHVATLCSAGYQSGEIVDDKFTGWWSIEQSESAA